MRELSARELELVAGGLDSVDDPNTIVVTAYTTVWAWSQAFAYWNLSSVLSSASLGGANAAPAPSTNHVNDTRASKALTKNGVTVNLTDVEQSTIVVNGHPVKVDIDNSLGASAVAADLSRIQNVLSFLDQHASSLSASEQADAAHINEIVVTAQVPRSGTDVGTGVFGINANELQNATVQWWASAVVHDGHHVTQYKNGKAYTGVAAEKDATTVQLDADTIFGDSTTDLNGLSTYIGNTAAINTRIDSWSRDTGGHGGGGNR